MSLPLMPFRLELPLHSRLIYWLSSFGSFTSSNEKATTKSKVTPKTCSYANLPRPLQLSVLKWLSFEDISRAAPACKALLNLTQEEDLLRCLYKREFPRRNLDKITYLEFFKRVKQEARAQLNYGHCFPIKDKWVSGLSCVRQSPVTGNLLLCSSDNNRSFIQVCDVTLKDLRKFSVDARIQCMAISFITGNLVLASEDCLFSFTEQGSEVLREKNVAKLCYMVSSPVADIFAALTLKRGAVRVFDASLKQSHVLTSPKEEFTCIAISPTTGHLVAGSMDKTILIWDMVSGASLKQFTSFGIPRCMQFCSGQLAVSLASCSNSPQETDDYFSEEDENRIAFYDDQGDLVKEKRLPAIFERECDEMEGHIPDGVTIETYPFIPTLMASCTLFPWNTYLMLLTEKGASDHWFKIRWRYECFFPIPGTHCILAVSYDWKDGSERLHHGKISLLDFTFSKELFGQWANSYQNKHSSNKGEINMIMSRMPKEIREEFPRHIDHSSNAEQEILSCVESSQSIPSSVQAIEDTIPKQH